MRHTLFAGMILALMGCGSTLRIPLTPISWTQGYVDPNPRRENVVIEPSETRIAFDTKLRFTAKLVEPDTLWTLFYWESKNPKILSVDMYGNGHAKAIGNADVCAKLNLYYIPVMPDGKTRDPEETSGTKLVVRSGSLKENCRKYKVTAPSERGK